MPQVQIPSTYRQPLPIHLGDPIPAQHQSAQPGDAWRMQPEPVVDNTQYKGADKLAGCTAIITGGDSGIGLAVAIAFAKEGADIAIAHLHDNADGEKAQRAVESLGRRFFQMACDLRREDQAQRFVADVMAQFGRIDIVVNNIAVQYPQNSIEDIDPTQLTDTFATNVLSYFFVTKAALPHLKPGASVINTASVTAYEGKETLIDYASTKGAIVSFTRSLSQSLAKNGIRVNAVAPGPVWTPLIPSSFSAEVVSQFGQNVPLGRPAQPFELAPAYVYLACDDSAYMTGQVLHVNGGTITES